MIKAYLRPCGILVRKNPSLVRRFVCIKSCEGKTTQISGSGVLPKSNTQTQTTLSLPYSPAPSQTVQSTILTRLGGDLGSRALGALLALDALGRLGSGGLGLLGLLAALGGGLLLLGVLDGLLAGGGTGLGALVAALLDHIERGTDDTTLALDSTAGTLLGNFLFAE